jgi:hypothetical protein
MGKIITKVTNKIYGTGNFPTAWKASSLHMGRCRIQLITGALHDCLNHAEDSYKLASRENE